MLRSLFAGISGLRAHQSMMDVTGNNIANVNTVGFKSSQTVFQDTLSQLLRGAGAPQGGNGGTNPSQVGLGVRLAGVTTNFGQGSAQTTGRATDLMIQGDGFFVVKNAGETLFTRAGAFSFDTGGILTTPEGGVVQGWGAVNGVVNTNKPVGNIVLPVGQVLSPVATTTATIGGNLPSDGLIAAPAIPAIPAVIADPLAVPPVVGSPAVPGVPAVVATSVPTSIRAFDALGAGHDLSVNFTKSATGWTLSGPAGAAIVPASISFTAGGAPNPPTFTYTDAANGLAVTVKVDSMTGFAGQASAAITSQDGSTMGTLQAFSMSPDGTLVGVFSNGLKQPLGQVALSNFNNPAGLEKVGGSMYRTTVNSGTEQLGAAGSGGRGLLSSGTLEMSNVDLAQEFTNLIVAQRGFQANSKVITTSDQILEDLVNLKR
jgi:flagellar hook protein FlgE